MPKIIKILSLFLLIASSSFSFVNAQEGAFTAGYEYTAGKLDSRATARALALEGVKDRLWRELWDDLEKLVRVRQLNLTAEQAAAVVPSLAEVRVVDGKVGRQDIQGRGRALRGQPRRPSTIPPDLEQG